MDPSTASIDGVRRLFQSSLPRGLALRSVTRVRSTKTKYNWNVTYTHISDEFPSPENFDRRNAQRLFRALRPEGLDVISLLTEEDSNLVVRWLVVYRIRRTVTFGDYLPKVIKSKKVEQSKSAAPLTVQCEQVPEQNTDDDHTWTMVKRKPRTKHTCPCPSKKDLDRFHYSVKTNDGVKQLKTKSDLKTDDLITKIYHCGKDITRKLTGKTRVFSGSKLVSFIKSSIPESPPPPPKELPSYNAVKFDYSETNSLRIKEKIKQNLSYVREYLAITQTGFPRKSNITLTGIGSSPVMQRKLFLLSEGLPVDEELMNEYLAFGNHLGLSSSELIGELEQRFKEHAQLERTKTSTIPLLFQHV